MNRIVMYEIKNSPGRLRKGRMEDWEEWKTGGRKKMRGGGEEAVVERGGRGGRRGRGENRGRRKGEEKKRRGREEKRRGSRQQRFEDDGKYKVGITTILGTAK